MLKTLWGLVSGGATGWIGAAIGGAKVLAIVALAGTVIWYIDDYGYQKRERLRLQGELQEAVIANQSLVEARQRAERRHQAENAARDRIDALERQQADKLVDLAKRLAALPADADCTGGDALQDLIDSLRSPQ